MCDTLQLVETDTSNSLTLAPLVVSNGRDGARAKSRHIPRLRGKSIGQETLDLLGFVRSVDPTEDLDVSGLESLLQSLSEISLKAENPLRNLTTIRAELFWVQGTILNRLHPIESGKHGLLPHGEWGAWLKSHGYSSTQADAQRWSSILFTREQARKLTCEAMRLHVAEHTASVKSKRGKGSKSKLSKGWRVLSDLAKKLVDAEGHLLNVVNELRGAIDLLDDPESSLLALSDAGETYTRIAGLLPQVEQAMEWATETVRDEQSSVERTLAEQRERGVRSDAA